MITQGATFKFAFIVALVCANCLLTSEAGKIGNSLKKVNFGKLFSCFSGSSSVDERATTKRRSDPPVKYKFQNSLPKAVPEISDLLNENHDEKEEEAELSDSLNYEPEKKEVSEPAKEVDQPIEAIDLLGDDVKAKNSWHRTSSVIGNDAPDDTQPPQIPAAYLAVSLYLSGENVWHHNLEANIEAIKKLLDSKMAEEDEEVRQIAMYMSKLASENICSHESLSNAAQALYYVHKVNKDMFGPLYEQSRLTELWSQYVDKLATECGPKLEYLYMYMTRGTKVKFVENLDKMLKRIDRLNRQYNYNQYKGERPDLVEMSGAWRSWEKYHLGYSSKIFIESLRFLKLVGEPQLDKKTRRDLSVFNLDASLRWKSQLIRPCVALVNSRLARELLRRASALGLMLVMRGSAEFVEPEAAVVSEGKAIHIMRWAARYITCSQLILGADDYEKSLPWA